MAVYFFGVYDGGAGATVDFNLWDDNAGTPGTIIGTTTITLANLSAALTANSDKVFCKFHFQRLSMWVVHHFIVELP